MSATEEVAVSIVTWADTLVLVVAAVQVKVAKLTVPVGALAVSPGATPKWIFIFPVALASAIVVFPGSNWGKAVPTVTSLASLTFDWSKEIFIVTAPTLSLVVSVFRFNWVTPVPGKVMLAGENDKATVPPAA